MTNHETYMAKAIEEAHAAARDGDAPTAAIIVQAGAVLATGRNTKTSDQSGFAHAELNALLAAKRLLGRRPDGCVLYATLEPCAMCLGAITFAGIRTVVYGARDPEGGAVALFRQHPAYRTWMPNVIGPILETQCEALKQLPTSGRGKRNGESRSTPNATESTR